MIWDNFHQKNFLITGASGFLGTALVHRIIDRTSASHLYLICRGGRVRLEKQWSRMLPSELAGPMLDPGRVTVLDGDILKPNFGLSPTEVQHLQGTIEVLIHSASSINLGSRLGKISDSIIGASEMVSKFALECDRLDRFVYLSTAYVNSYLYAETEATDVEVEENFYTLPTSEAKAADEWAAVRRRGAHRAYETHEFPWAYSYAKHLTERLLTQSFTEAGEIEKLLIIRPSIIGPAASFPFPTYCVPTSSPLTMMIAGGAANTSTQFTAHTRSKQPEIDSTADEVPVDVVVDRLLAHLAHRTEGPVHAVSGKRARWRFKDWWRAVNVLRQPSMPPILPTWTSLHWRSPELHPVARLYAVIGTSFNFLEGKTERLWRNLSAEDRTDLQLFATRSAGDTEDWVIARKESIQTGMEEAMGRKPTARL